MYTENKMKPKKLILHKKKKLIRQIVSIPKRMYIQ